MPATIAGRNTSSANLAGGATWTGNAIPLQRETSQGNAAIGDIFTGYYHCEGQPSTWWVEGSEDGIAWFVIGTGVELAHVAGAAGKSVKFEVPAKFGRMRVQNTGGGPTTNFRAFGQFTAY